MSEKPEKALGYCVDRNSWARKRVISKKEYDIHWDLAFGKITRKKHDEKIKGLK